MPTISEILTDAKTQLASVSDTAALDAELLLLHILDKSKTFLFTWPDHQVTEAQLSAFNALLARRTQGEPVAHILGHREFWSLSLAVNPSTLIPRPDTERLVELGLDFAVTLASGKGLDLGTGTGAIALAMASELPKWQWIGIDKQAEAVELAKTNQVRNHIENCQFLQSDWFANISEQKFNLILSNPPYIDKNDIHLSRGDVRFEPHSALVAEGQGLADIELICDKSRNYIETGGALMLEHGYQQGIAVREILTRFGYHNVATFQDLGGNDRVSVGYF